MKINWYIRFKNPQYVFQVILAILTPILAYAGLTFQDLTSWKAVGNMLFGAISNPYVLGLVGVSVYNATTDPTVRSWLKDSDLSMGKTEPTHPEQEISIKGDDVVDDNSEIIVDNTEVPKSYAEEVD